MAETRRLDVRGKACPLPVVETRKVLMGEPGLSKLEVLLSNATSCENVIRTARSLGCAAEGTERPGGEFLVAITPPAGGVESAETATGSDQAEDLSVMSCSVPAPKKVVVLFGTDALGVGNDELGRTLIRGFIKTLPETRPEADSLLFMNNGVNLTTEGSEVIEDLEKLAATGVRILTCGTCLDFYGLRENLRVGRVTNMLESATLLMSADHVVRI